MKSIVLDVPSFTFVLGTRVALAAGIGLLVSDKLSDTRRRAIGTTLIALGAATTLPAAISVVRGLRRARRSALTSSLDRDPRLIGATRFPRKGDDD
jgi:hypothetical protein